MGERENRQKEKKREMCVTSEEEKRMREQFIQLHGSRIKSLYYFSFCFFPRVTVIFVRCSYSSFFFIFVILMIILSTLSFPLKLTSNLNIYYVCSHSKFSTGFWWKYIKSEAALTENFEKVVHNLFLHRITLIPLDKNQNSILSLNLILQLK